MTLGTRQARELLSIFYTPRYDDPPVVKALRCRSVLRPGSVRIKHAKAPAIHCVGRNGVQWRVLACRGVPVGTDRFLEDLHRSHAHNRRRYGRTL